MFFQENHKTFPNSSFQCTSRLCYSPSLGHLDHRRGVKNVLGVTPGVGGVLLLGVGVFGGEDEEVLDEEAVITFDRTTTKVTVYQEKWD